MALPLPNWIRSWWWLGFGTFGKVPWSQCPTHQIFIFEGCSGGALHWDVMFSWNWHFRHLRWCPHTSSAKRIYTARFWLVCGILRSGLRMVANDISQWFAVPLPSVHTSSIGRSSIPGTDMGHPKGDVYFRLKFSLVLPRWYIACNHKVHDVCIPRVGVLTFSRMLLLRKLLMGSSCIFVTCICDKWSATVFSTPFYLLFLGQILGVKESSGSSEVLHLS
jgi:hypothetical protein